MAEFRVVGLKSNARDKVRLASLLVLSGALGMSCTAADSSSDGELVTEASIPLGGLSEFQQQIFEDGEVSFPEYERAFFQLVSCINDTGIEAEGPNLEDDGTLSFVTATPAGMSDEELVSLVGNCEDEYTSAVELGFADSVAPSEEEEFTFYADVVSCVIESGVDDVEPLESLDSGILTRIHEQHPQVYESCLISTVNE